MFERAKNCEKSIIFLDECESFCKIRSDHDSNHASSCKTEMLTQLGEIAGHLKVFVIGATNVPYLMDAAFRRRFATQVYIPLPNEKDREKLFRFEVSRWRHILTDKHFKDLAKRTGGYSNSDIAGMAKDARKEPTKEAYYGKYFVVCFAEITHAPAQIISTQNIFHFRLLQMVSWHHARPRNPTLSRRLTQNMENQGY